MAHTAVIYGIFNLVCWVLSVKNGREQHNSICVNNFPILLKGKASFSHQFSVIETRMPTGRQREGRPHEGVSAAELELSLHRTAWSAALGQQAI